MKSGANNTLYIGGVETATTTNTMWAGSDMLAALGNFVNGGYSNGFIGYMDEARIVPYVVYTGDFTPPAAPLSLGPAPSPTPTVTPTATATPTPTPTPSATTPHNNTQNLTALSDPEGPTGITTNLT